MEGFNLRIESKEEKADTSSCRFIRTTSSVLDFFCSPSVEGDSVILERTKENSLGVNYRIIEILVYGEDKKVPVVVIVFAALGGVSVIGLIFFCNRYICRSKPVNRPPAARPAEPVPMVHVIDPVEARDQPVTPSAPPSDVTKLPPPSYQDSTSVHSGDQVPSYEDVMANSTAFYHDRS